MNKELAAQFLSAIITRNSGQRIEDDVKEALAYAEAFERLTDDYTTPQAVLDLVQNPTMELPEEQEYSLCFNDTCSRFFTEEYRNELFLALLSGYRNINNVTFLATANNGILSTWTDKVKLFEYYKDAKDVLVLSCFTETDVKQKIDAYYEERGGFVKHVEYLKSIGQW